MLSQTTILFFIFACCITNINAAEMNEGESCKHLKYQVTKSNSGTEIMNPPVLDGKWTSDRCETHDGPQYALRSYTFFPNSTFHFLRFHYRDESCSRATFSISISGVFRMKNHSSSVAGGMRLTCDVSRVSITPQDGRAARQLSRVANESCISPPPDGTWKPHREYILYSKYFADVKTDNSVRNRSAFEENRRANRLSHEKDILYCLSLFNASFKEFRLFRVQMRPEKDGMRRELLLENPANRSDRLKTSSVFQLPLIHVSNSAKNNCGICDAVARATRSHVPHFQMEPAAAVLTTFFNGEWISGRCELKFGGFYTLRNFRVNAANHSWRMEYRYYSHPDCREPALLSNQVTGSYRLGISDVVGGAMDLDTEMETFWAAIFDSSLLNNVRNELSCGEEWMAGISREIYPLECPLVALAPLPKRDVMKIEVDAEGTFLLYMGEISGNNRQDGEEKRPTFYQYPLIRCSSGFPTQNKGQISPVKCGRRLLVGSFLTLISFNLFFNYIYISF